MKTAVPDNLESLISETGRALHASLVDLLAEVPEADQGPQSLARATGIDKVLASRVLKATRCSDPMSALFCMPGPDPLRRLVSGVVQRGSDGSAALVAIDRFERLIRVDVGDRSALDTIVSAWVPEARREFELRRKQAAFKAMSQLKGAQAKAILSTVILHPAEDEALLDIVWLSGMIGIHRLRPGAPVKFATRRLSAEDAERRPQTIGGEVVTDIEGVQLTKFCSDPLPRLNVLQGGEVTHYTLDDAGFGPRSAADFVTAEVNRAEMRRTIPRGSNRKAYVFAESSIPAVALQFDAFVHTDVYPGREPSLRLYDAALEGVADINDPARDIDRLELLESIDGLGLGTTMCRSTDVPRYHEMMNTVFERLGWDARSYRGYRCRIDYPVYGSQIAMVFDPPEG